MANTVIQVKKSATSGNVPPTLANGELAINYADGKLYYKTTQGGTGYIYSSNSFSTINASGTLVLASANTDTLSIIGTYGVSVSACTTTKTIIVSDGSTYNVATSSYAAQNITAGFANASYTAQNTTASFANGAFVTANSGASFANGAFITANSGASFANGAFTAQNTTASFANAAFTVANTANAIYSNGGTIAGQITISNGTGSVTYQSGALVVNGGVGIGQNLNVLGNTIISGALTVQGTTTYTSSTTTSYANPYIMLQTPATGYLTSDSGFDVGVEFEYYQSATSGPRAIIGGSGTGSTATLSIADNTYFPPGTVVLISDVTPSGFNGTYTVTSATVGSISFACTQTGSVNTSGALGVLRRVTEFTGASATRQAC